MLFFGVCFFLYCVDTVMQSEEHENIGYFTTIRRFQRRPFVGKIAAAPRLKTRRIICFIVSEVVKATK